jgi:L-arabinokinase
VPAVVFYISGHGFGHASREIELINALASRLPAYDIVVRTSAARWIFDRTVRVPFTLIEGACDTGVVQIDSLHLDARKTIEEAAAFYRQLPRHTAREAALLREHDAAFVIADAPPLGCVAARAAGVPCAVLSNFTWDWIYEGYVDQLAAAPDLLPLLRDAYRAAPEAWRLPFHGGFATFDQIIDVPLIARHARHEPDEVRRLLHLPSGVPLALSSFGGYGVRDFNPESLDCLDTWCVVTTGAHAAPPLPRGAAFVDERKLYDAGLRYEDLVRAVDVVVTKPGFGIVAECIANDTAMLYTSRGRFVEYEVMVEEMPRFLRCQYLDVASLLAGRWRDALERLRLQPPAPERPRTDGAAVVAEMIAERAGGRLRR